MKQYLKKLEGTTTPVATRYKPAFSDSEYTGFGELYRNGKWYKDVDIPSTGFTAGNTGRLLSYDYTDGTNTATLTDDPSNASGYFQVNLNFTSIRKYRLYITVDNGFEAEVGGYLNFQVQDGDGNRIVGDGITSIIGDVIYSYDFVSTNGSGSSGTRLSLYANDPVVTTWTWKIVPLNDDGSIDISNATELTTPQTYLPIEVDVDEQGNLLNVDRMDLPTLVEDYVVAKNIKCDEANFVNGWKSEGMDAYACRAWVNFNGTGTVAIRESGNVSSITDNGTGNYTINFTTAMPDANYAMIGTSGGDSNWSSTEFGETRTTTSCNFRTGATNTSSLYDWVMCSVAIFR